MCNDIQVLSKRSEQTDPQFLSTGALSPVHAPSHPKYAAPSHLGLAMVFTRNQSPWLSELPLIYCLNCHMQSCISNGHKQVVSGSRELCQLQELVIYGFCPVIHWVVKAQGQPRGTGPQPQLPRQLCSHQGAGTGFGVTAASGFLSWDKKILWWTLLPPS